MEKDLNYDDIFGVTARVKVDMPLILPNVYIMSTPTKFDGKGSKSVDFNFGGINFKQDVEFDSEVTLNSYDVALYYGIPFLKTASLDKVNVDVGINMRIYDFQAKISQETLNSEASASLSFPVLMVFLAAQLKPIDVFAVEAEVRGKSYDENQIYSLIGRLKVKVFGPLFAAGGYRYDKIKFDSEDVEADITLSGPFVEAGFAF